jgi:hypothetical protein
MKRFCIRIQMKILIAYGNIYYIQTSLIQLYYKSFASQESVKFVILLVL